MAVIRHADANDGAAIKRSGEDHNSSHASEQALHGMKDFHQVKSAMFASHHKTMKNYDGAAGAPSIVHHDGNANENTKLSHGGELKAPETHDRLSHEPYAAAQQRDRNERQPMDENGNRSEAVPRPNNPYQASSHVENGRVESATLTDRGGSTTYSFDTQGKTASVTDSRQNGTSVTNYSRDGHVASKTFTDSKPGASPEPVAFNKNDQSEVTNKDGKTTITTKTGKETSTVTLDGKGNVQSNSFQSPRETFHTEYNSDGSMKSDSTIDRDAEGRVTSEERQTPRSDDRAEYDSKHKVVKTVHKTGDSTYTNQKFPDGSTMQQTVGPRGEQTVVHYPDGTRLEHSSDGKSESSKITNPDGSSVRTTNDNYASTYKKTDKNGNWDLYQYTKGGGTKTHSSGGPDSEDYIGGRDIERPI